MFKINRRSHTGLIASFLFAFAVIAPLHSSTASSSSSVVDFNLRNIEGGQVSSQTLRGNVVVMAFGASWLPLSRTQVQGLQELSDQYNDRNVKVYWVSTDSDSQKSKNYATDEQLRAFAQKNSMKVTVLRDPDGALFKQFGADQLPAVVVLDREGKISGAPIGGLDPNGKLVDQLASRLTSLL